MSMTDNSDEKIVFEKIPYIYYLVCFQKYQEQIKILFDSGSKVNTMSLVYVKKLGFKTWKTNFRAQKIKDSISRSLEW